ncbi:MAG TPA: glutamate decarboxylase [Verrucomicrobiae bacterium]|nr:glutamate decarboxylase [Verrucomicrobiae bacterium]
MWTVVFIAPNKTTAEMYKSILLNEGLLVQLRAIGSPNHGENCSVEILVPESEAEEAHDIIISARGT